MPFFDAIDHLMKVCRMRDRPMKYPGWSFHDAYIGIKWEQWGMIATEINRFNDDNTPDLVHFIFGKFRKFRIFLR